MNKYSSSKGIRKVDPNLYDKEYFLSNNIGFEEFKTGLESSKIHYKFLDVLECCNFTPETRVLDIGCGRGEMVYYAAKKGCKEAVGIDYSVSAINLATSLKSSIELSTASKISFLNIDALDLPADEPFDYIFMIEVWEHLYDEQLVPLLNKVASLLKNKGQLIITTPNGFYEKYLYPAKRLLNIPGNLFKYPLRILRGKYKPSSMADLFKHIFKVRPFHNAFMDATHVNICSPQKIKRFLASSGFKSRIKCSDTSIDPLSLMFARYAGREMLVIAEKNN
jgi:2-polyprenyl-3-methyl-5-hydroxy-6-metoxy-1,4-benzoquinol methylase